MKSSREALSHWQSVPLPPIPHAKQRPLQLGHRLGTSSEVMYSPLTCALPMLLSWPVGSAGCTTRSIIDFTVGPLAIRTERIHPVKLDQVSVFRGSCKVYHDEMLLAPVRRPIILLRRRDCINSISSRVTASSDWVGRGVVEVEKDWVGVAVAQPDALIFAPKEDEIDA